jgi:hypothetical protein
VELPPKHVEQFTEIIKKLYIVASYWTIIDIAPMFGFPYEILHVSL